MILHKPGEMDNTWLSKSRFKQDYSIQKNYNGMCKNFIALNHDFLELKRDQNVTLHDQNVSLQHNADYFTGKHSKLQNTFTCLIVFPPKLKHYR